MRFVAVSTNSSPGLDRYLASARRFGVEPQVLGMGMPFRGHGTKFLLAREALRTFPPDEIVVATDCWDVIFLRDPAALLDEFLKFECGLVFSAEPGFVYAAKNKFQQFRRYPHAKPTSEPYRFLNGGAWIGYAGYVYNVLKAIDSEEHDCDQTLLNAWFIENPECMKLDYEQRIFASTIWREGFENSDFQRSEKGLRHRRTGTYPFFMHFGGENAISSRRVLKLVDFPLPEVPPHAGYRRQFLVRVATNWMTNAFGVLPYPYVNVAELTGKIVAVIAAFGALGFALGLR